MDQPNRTKKIVEKAQAIYRAAWEAYLLTDDEEQKLILEKTMDDAQINCTSDGRLGSEWNTFEWNTFEWNAFKTTLLGYNDYWKELEESMLNVFLDKFKDVN